MTSISKGRDKHPASAILFFKIILGKTLEDGKLKLPKSFTRKYGSGMPKQVFLKPPDGIEWRVCWTKHDDEILLEKGWKEFATYYSLDHGYLVLFQYKKEASHFEVHIFDLSGLEIDYDEKVQILDEKMPTSLNTKLKKPQVFSSPQPCKKLRTDTTEDARTSYNFQNPPQLDQINGSQSQGTNFEKSTFVSVKKELDEDISGVTQCPQVEQSNIATEEFNRAKTSRPRNPSFVIDMKRSYANNYTLHVPSNFAEVYLKDMQGPTLVEVEVQDGRTWTISYSLGKFNSGWKRFASDNNLNVGDILIFELTDRKDLSFKVSISRGAQPPSCPVLQGGKEAQRTSMEIGTDSSSNEAMRKAMKFTSENPFFISSIKESFQGTGRPKLPNNFTRKYGGGLSNPMFLKPPDGTEWKVCWTKHDDEIFLEKGWKEFATYYSLDHGNLVLFEYKKSSNFVVHIFGISGLEIDYCLNDNLDYINDETIEISDGMPMFDSPQPCKKLRTGTSRDGRTSYNLQDLPQHNRSKGTNLPKSMFASDNEKLDEDIGGITQCPEVEQPTKLTEASKRDRTLRLRNPSFMVVMTPSYANNNSVSIPSRFAKEHLKGKKGATLLQVQDGRSWSAIYNVGNIYSGWKRFASDNNLKVGDICVFELIDLKGLSFKVSISRAAKEPNCSESQDNSGGKATQKNSLVISPDSGTNGAKKEAEKFTSENPFFMVSIKPNFLVSWKPVVPAAFIKKYLDKKKQTLTLQIGDKWWHVTLLCYAYNTSSKFSDGWLLFVRETELQAGDVCIFELVNREGAVFDVHIFRCHY